jgi:membrane protein DedA with SNARE-associated domain|tara:strand:+ start:1593 stop:2174 length:582 start_codon:yes stop_codon:yes gene_type:complete
MFENLHSYIEALIEEHGNIGIFLGMFLESSILPIPSELVLITAGALGLPVISIVVFGSIGSTLGASVGYYIGRKGGRPFINHYGKYLLITESKLITAEAWVKKYGNITVLVSRIIPFIPFKVFSISAGILHMNFASFILYTFLGMIPRTFVLAYLGKTIMVYKVQGLILLAITGIGVYVFYLIFKKFRHDDVF